jgi:hypothetical protein
MALFKGYEPVKGRPRMVTVLTSSCLSPVTAPAHCTSTSSISCRPAFVRAADPVNRVHLDSACHQPCTLAALRCRTHARLRDRWAPLWHTWQGACGIAASVALCAGIGRTGEASDRIVPASVVTWRCAKRCRVRTVPVSGAPQHAGKPLGTRAAGYVELYPFSRQSSGVTLLRCSQDEATPRLVREEH